MRVLTDNQLQLIYSFSLNCRVLRLVLVGKYLHNSWQRSHRNLTFVSQPIMWMRPQLNTLHRAMHKPPFLINLPICRICQKLKEICKVWLLTLQPNSTLNLWSKIKTVWNSLINSNQCYHLAEMIVRICSRKEIGWILIERFTLALKCTFNKSTSSKCLRIALEECKVIYQWVVHNLLGRFLHVNSSNPFRVCRAVSTLHLSTHKKKRLLSSRNSAN